MTAEKEKIKVLFLCTGNSCRSQMAEGWAGCLRGDVIESFSAGVCPVGINQRAIEVMTEAGVDISRHYSKHVEDIAGIEFDCVVTLCDNAKEQCPVFPSKCKMIHRNFEDPSFITGTNEQVMEAFRKTRDQIRAFIETMPESLENFKENEC